MRSFKVIAFTHKYIALELLGALHLDESNQAVVLPDIKSKFQLDELLFLSTCNRVELFICSKSEVNPDFISRLVQAINPGIEEPAVQQLADGAEVYAGHEAAGHVFRVASSLDSLVVGEREIITQVRKAYDYCNSLKLTGDFIRLLIRYTIETAKEIYTNTAIARHPVSVASLAYRQLRQLGIKDNARIVFVGSGQTNTTLANYFKKHRFANFTVFNRSHSNATTLAAVLGAKAFTLSELHGFENGFDVLVVCTASQKAIINNEVFNSLLNGEAGKKVVIDLGVPANVDDSVAGHRQVHYINIASLKEQAGINLNARKNEVLVCEEIIKAKTLQFKELHNERRIELAFGEVPRQVKAIKETALTEVFAKDLDTLDDKGKEVLDKVLSYIEKKYNAVAIKTAKEVFRSPDFNM